MKKALGFKHFVILIFLLALIVRLVMGVIISFDFTSTNQWFAAKNIARGLGYSIDPQHPTAFRTPGYPLILAIFIKLFGAHTLPIIIFLAIIGAINAVLCGLLARRIFNPLAGWIAGLLYTFIPYLAQKETTTQSGLVATGLLAGTYFLFEARLQRKLIYILFSAASFLFAYFIRPTVGLIPLFIVLVLLVEGWENKSRWYGLAALVFLAFFIAGLLPWALRNSKALRHFHIGQSNFWSNLYVANNRHTFDLYPYTALDNFGPIYLRKEHPPAVNEFEIEEWYRKKTLEELKFIPPPLLLKRSLQKFIYLWHIRLVPYADRIGNNPYTGQSLDKPRPRINNAIYSIPYIILLVFTFIACWQARARIKLLLFFAGFLFFFSLPHMVFVAYSKYATAAYFVLIIFASRGIAYLFQKQPQR